MNYQNIKVWRTTIQNLRLIYAFSQGETMVSIVDRLVTAELTRIQKKWEDQKKTLG